MKFSELKAARAGMTTGEWWMHDDDGSIGIGAAESDGPNVGGDVDLQLQDVIGICTLVNAADVLIEIVEAASEYANSPDWEARERLTAALARVEL